MTPQEIQQAEEWIEAGEAGRLPGNTCFVFGRVLPLYRKYIAHLKGNNETFILRILEMERVDRERTIEHLELSANNQDLRDKIAKAFRKIRALDGALDRSTAALQRLIDKENAADAAADWEALKDQHLIK